MIEKNNRNSKPDIQLVAKKQKFVNLWYRDQSPGMNRSPKRSPNQSNNKEKMNLKVLTPKPKISKLTKTMLRFSGDAVRAARNATHNKKLNDL